MDLGSGPDHFHETEFRQHVEGSVLRHHGQGIRDRCSRDPRRRPGVTCPPPGRHQSRGSGLWLLIHHPGDTNTRWGLPGSVKPPVLDRKRNPRRPHRVGGRLGSTHFPRLLPVRGSGHNPFQVRGLVSVGCRSVGAAEVFGFRPSGLVEALRGSHRRLFGSPTGFPAAVLVVRLGMVRPDRGGGSKA